MLNLNSNISFFCRLFNKIEILKIGQKQFDIMQAFLKYCRLKLQKQRINSFIEPDKALSASKVLILATDSILKEVNETDLKLKELEAVIITVYTYISVNLYYIYMYMLN